jgi:hypothetical protein
MISSEVQRTLVKSPPELWAELSDPESLSRHLGELGEIRITRREPEKRVEWEAGGTSGSVLIKPSGWGTKVTLSVTRDVALPEPETIPETEAAAEATAEPSPEVSAEPEQEEPLLETPPAPDLEAAAEPALEVVPVEVPLEAAVAEAVPEAAALEVEPRRGFFARLFGRRRPKVTETPEPAPEHTSESTLEAPPTPDQASPPLASGSPGSAIESLQARFQAQPAVEDPPAAEAAPAPEPPAAQMDLAAELEAAEEMAVEEVTALLTGVLDRLGAAHHRPFSRS